MIDRKPTTEDINEVEEYLWRNLSVYLKGGTMFTIKPKQKTTIEEVPAKKVEIIAS